MNLYDALVTKALVGEGGGSAPSGQVQTLIPEQSFTATENQGNFYTSEVSSTLAEDDNVMSLRNVTVTFDGTEFYFDEAELGFGADVQWGIMGQTPSADFSVYPFYIEFFPMGAGVLVADTNEHTVSVTGILMKELSIEANGEYDVQDYAMAYVNVPTGITPTGTKNITSNGDWNVTEYATAHVNVPNPSSGTLNITTNGVYDVTNKASVNVQTQALNQNGTITLVNTFDNISFNVFSWGTVSPRTYYLGYGQTIQIQCPTYDREDGDHPNAISWDVSMSANSSIAEGTISVTGSTSGMAQNGSKIFFGVYSSNNSATITIGRP